MKRTIAIIREVRHLLLFACICAFSACSGGQNGDNNQQPQSERTLKENGGGDRVVASIDEPAFEQLITERNGKVLLLNVWATWCLPCKEEFPDLVRLAQDTSGRDVEIVGLSVDFPDEVESRIKPFLQEQHANFKIYVADFKDQDSFINGLNPEWSGALPATFIFDSNGKRKAFMLGKHTYQQFKEALGQ